MFWGQEQVKAINSFHVIDLFLYSLKKSENNRFFIFSDGKERPKI